MKIAVRWVDRPIETVGGPAYLRVKEGGWGVSSEYKGKLVKVYNIIPIPDHYLSNRSHVCFIDGQWYSVALEKTFGVRSISSFNDYYEASI
jgi:hypothetical protein